MAPVPKRKVTLDVASVPKKKKVKGLHPFPNKFMVAPHFDGICEYDSWFEKGLKIKNKDFVLSLLFFYLVSFYQSLSSRY